MEITHFVHLKTTNCIIATAKEIQTQRTKVFLIAQDRLYKRNGLQQNWSEIKNDQNQPNQVLREKVYGALKDSTIPWYSTSSSIN